VLVLKHEKFRLEEKVKMFKMLKNNTPVRKTSCTIKKGDYEATYVATKTRENVIIRKDGELVGGIYVSIRMLKELNVRTEKIEVFGEWKKFEWVVLEGEMPQDISIEWDKIAKGQSNKVKGQTYDTYEDANAVSNMSFGAGDSVEDFLYKNVTVSELEKEHDLEWAKHKNYRILIEDDEIMEWIKGLDETTEIVGFDTETTGLNVNRTKLDKLVGICMSYEDDAGVYFPIRQERMDNVRMGEEKLLELLKPYCDKNSPKAKDLVLHNGGYDWKVMKMYDWELNIVYDTLIRQSVQNVALAKNLYQLKKIVKSVFGYDTVELEDMYEKRTPAEIKEIAKAVENGQAAVNPITRRKLETAVKQNDLMDFRFASKEFVELYGPGDADFPRLLHKEMDKEWDNELDFTYRLEISIIPVLGEQEYYGVRADREGFETLHEKAIIKADKLEQQIYQQAGMEFNINSGKQLGEVLFEKMGCPKNPKFKTKTGQWSTSSKVLKEIEKYEDNQGNLQFPIVKMLREYSKTQKLINSFYGKLPEMIVEGHLFSQYRQTGADTGRLSCSRPNLQQTETTSREYMIPDTEDHYFLICDYSQVEYRIMAGMSDEKKVVDFFKKDAEADYHILAYANMMKKPYEDVTSAERDDGKILNFGTSYGLQDPALALALYGDDSKFAQKKAAQARRDYFAGVPTLRDYFEDIRDLAEEKGYAETLFGRRRVIPEFKGGVRRLSPFTRSSGRRKAGNHPVQGTAADIMKMAMARIRNKFISKGYKEDMARLVMNIHDEVVLQLHKSINPWYATKLVREAMEIDLSEQGFPPLYIGANVGNTWKDGKVDELEAPVYLMNEKIAEIDAMIERGEELPSYDDPKQMWEDEINKFALRVIKEEMQKGYRDKETDEVKTIQVYSEALKNPRLAKYSHHFGDNGAKVVMELLTDTPENVYKRLNKLSTLRTKRSAVAISRIKKVIVEEKIETLDDAAKQETNINEKSYYGEHGWTVVQRLLTEAPKEVFRTMEDYINEEEYKPVAYEAIVSREGKDITEDIDSVMDHIKKHMLRYNKVENKIIMKPDFDDMEMLSFVDKMLVPTTSLDMFQDDERKCSFSVIYANGEEFETTGYMIFRKYAPILRELLKRHVTGMGYDGIEEEIAKVGNQILKTEEEIESIEKNRLEKIKNSYKRSQTKEEIDKIKFLKKQAMSYS